MRYVNVGNESLFLLRRDGRLERLEATGRPIGLMSGGGFAERRVTVATGDRLFMYTAGLVDAENEAGAAFGPDRLETLLAGGGAAHPAAPLAPGEPPHQEHPGTTGPPDHPTPPA